jgi:hypothetical protein
LKETRAERHHRSASKQNDDDRRPTTDDDDDGEEDGDASVESETRIGMINTQAKISLEANNHAQHIHSNESQHQHNRSNHIDTTAARRRSRLGHGLRFSGLSVELPHSSAHTTADRRVARSPDSDRRTPRHCPSTCLVRGRNDQLRRRINHIVQC